MDNAAIAQRLFAALAGHDDPAVRDLCSPDLRVRQNGGKPMGLEALLRFSGAVGRIVPDFHYADAVRAATDAGFVEEHAVRGTLPNGKALRLRVCVVAEVRDGKITDVREYFDSAAATDLVAALG
jgi:ketosteroid isomerase-like protein